jgi:GTPase SAR1 family protein
MKGIIVLDGPDACGKTTLANTIKEVCKKINVPYYYQHAEYKFKNRMFCYHEALVRRAIKFSQSGIAVIDRLHWSEYVYSTIYRGSSKWPLQWRYFDRLLQKYAALNVICVADTAEEVRSWHKIALEKREEMYDNRMDEIASQYISILNARDHRRDYIQYNWMRERLNTEGFAAMLLTELRELRAEQPGNYLRENSYEILGNVSTAEYLFIGERLNNKSRHQIWPFWEYANSSLHLTQTLDKLNFDESKAVWVNYYDNPDTIGELLEYNKNLKLITLGQRLGEKLWNKGIKSVFTYHPSYAKRFNLELYDKHLEKALKNARTF